MRDRRLRVQLAAILCTAALAALAPSAALAAAGGLRCHDMTFAVTLSPEDAQVHQVFGVLCARGSIQGKTIQIALHGSTYSHLYWDWPLHPEVYSYVRRATAAGYAILDLDRIGIGRSDHPPAAQVDIAANAHVVHQIVQDLRGGGLVVPSFGRLRAGRVALVGHSLGSLVAIQESATYGDVDGMALTGISHNVTPVLGEAAAAFYPASLDPRFAGQGIPDGYLTTIPGDRTIFYQAPFFDPAVLALDEETKETVTTAELDTAFAALALAGGIHVPVLVMVGDFDLAFCDAPSCSASGSLASEPGFYAPDACAETAIVPQAGHVLNLHLTAPLAYDGLLDWMDRRVGRDAGRPAPEPCQP